MDLTNLHALTNDFVMVKLISLRSWKGASEITPRDSGGPYVVMQEGYDPTDSKMSPDEFLLGRSGKWLSLGIFQRLPVEVRRPEFVFGTAAEVMTLMRDLPPKVAMYQAGEEKQTPAAAGLDDLTAAVHAGRSEAKAGSTTSTGN